MARIGRLAFLAIAVVFHFIYGNSIFDVYFVSPIVSGMRAFKVDTAKAPAKRLVLYVVISLRQELTAALCRRWTSCGQSISILSRSLRSYRRHLCSRATPIDALSKVASTGTRYVWCIAHSCTNRVKTWSCSSHCRVVRRCVFCHNGVEVEPGEFRQCLQQEQPHVELGKP